MQIRMEQTHEHLIVDRPASGVCLITLNRPRALNALTLRMQQTLDEALTQIETDDAVRCVGADRRR